MTKSIYRVGVEVNDTGWSFGYHHFENVIDAIRFMRQCAAYEILNGRARGAKVECLKIWSDSVMEETPRIGSQSVTFLINGVPYDFRVWAVKLHSDLVSLSSVAYNF